jgi:hypothetical protein
VVDPKRDRGKDLLCDSLADRPLAYRGRAAHQFVREFLNGLNSVRRWASKVAGGTKASQNLMLQGSLRLVHLMTFRALDCIEKCAGARMAIAKILLTSFTPIGVVDRDLVSTGNTLNLFRHLTPPHWALCDRDYPMTLSRDNVAKPTASPKN